MKKDRVTYFKPGDPADVEQFRKASARVVSSAKKDKTAALKFLTAIGYFDVMAEVRNENNAASSRKIAIPKTARVSASSAEGVPAKRKSSKKMTGTGTKSRAKR